MGPESEKWLTRPGRKRRVNWEAYCYLPYSFKVLDRVVIYTPERCNHWVEVEFDEKITTFNEAPPLVELPYGGKVHPIQFDMVCLMKGGQVTLRRLYSGSKADSNDALESELDRWAEKSGLTIERIALADLENRKTAIENQKDLLHFALACKDCLDPLLDEQILGFVINNPGVTLAATQERFRAFDQTLVGGRIAQLLLRNQLHANLSGQRFNRNLALLPR